MGQGGCWGRGVWLWGALLGLALSMAAPAAAQEPNRLVLLGTMGGPILRGGGHSQPVSNLLILGGVPYVVDCGYGVTRRLVEAGFPLASLRYIFITHHHSDHNLEYGNLLYNAWAAGLKNQVRTYGPVGMVEMTQVYWHLNRFDITIRMTDEGRANPRPLVQPHDFGEGLVLQNGQVKVTALRVKHPPIREAYALKFEGAGKVVVFSGDTVYCPRLAQFAKGADVLVHEVMALPAVEALERSHPQAAQLFRHLRDSHSPARDVGRVATEAGVKTLVLTHFVPADEPALSEETWRRAVAQTYPGKIIVGRDLLVVPLD